MTSVDRYKEAAALTTSLDLPQETALPARRKRNHSIIPVELMNPSEGGMERAALATVFGVREYTEPKVFWERQILANTNDTIDNDQPSSSAHPTTTSGISQGQASITNKSILSNPLNSNISTTHRRKHMPPPQDNLDTTHSQQSIASYVDSVLETVGKGQFKTTMPNNTTSHRTVTFALPDIPVVSKFDDWLLTSSSSPSSQALPSPLSNTSVTSGNNTYHGINNKNSAGDSYQQQQQSAHLMHAKSLVNEVAPPLVFLSYPPAIFDLLKSDTDDRIITWGPDPQAISASGATTTSGTIIRNQPPSSVGFSSNTTSTTMSIHSANSINEGSGKKSKSRWINKVKQSLQHSSSSNDDDATHYNEKNGQWSINQQKQKQTLRSRFVRRRSLSSKKDQQQQHYSSSPLTTLHLPSSQTTVVAPKVIEAATVEKLVEKLTVTLDYTFMTDFFLTYRTFISPTQLCKLLILRFRWGLENNEDDRCIVRIRTFVVIRHWLLNYFVHDFTPSRELRETLTMFLNALPSHTLIKHSPRDQRIVKGLKRVVRRLKKVHYPSSSQHVQVISPPPPVFDEDQVRHMVHAKLTQSPLRRKTEGLIQKGMAVEDRHHGNVAFQDARTAEIVIIGSSDRSPLPPQPVEIDQNRPSSVAAADSIRQDDSLAPLDTSDHGNNNNNNNKRNRNVSQNSIAKYATSAFVRGRHHQQELQKAKVKESYLRRMEQQKRLMEQQQQTSLDVMDQECHDQQQSRHSSFISDASLESLVSPGTTDDELYDDEDDYETDDSDADDMELAPPTDNVAQQHTIIRAPSQRGSNQHRRSVYNAELSDLSPLASPAGSGIQGSTHGPSLASNNHPPTNRQLMTSATHQVNKETSSTHRRVSWNNNRLSRSFSENNRESMVVKESPAMVDSPTSISSPPMPLEKQVRPEMHSDNKSKPQRKLSKRLMKAFRSAGNIRSGRATTMDPPDMTTSSTAPSTISHSSLSTQQRQNSKRNSTQQPHDATWKSSTTTSHPPSSHFDDLRTSLDDILPPPLPVHQQAEQPSRRIIELDIPRWGNSSDITTLFRSSMVLEQRSHDLAQQLCLVEKWVLLQVDWEEMVHCRWTKMGNDSSMTDDYKRMDENGDMFDDDDDHPMTYYSRQTRQLQLMRGEQEGGVQQLIKRFNTVCQWVSSEIVRTQALDERVLVIEKFIRLAQKCQVYSNFATLVQILLGLQSPSVSRLRKTWARVSDSDMRLLEQLSAFTSPMKNWKHIRDNMTVVAEEYGMSPKAVQIQLPGSVDRQLHQPKIKLPFGGCIPFLGLYLSDLVFNSEQPSYLEPSHDHHKIYQSYTKLSPNISPLLLQPLVNFRKHRIIATIIKRFLTFRDLASRYSFEQMDPLYTECFHLDALETDTIRQLSLIIEPPPLTT
ncbi:ras guanine nucleotide exchange factor domain-containing protein [Chlamydoabsidia padenii]|nr:ras guanine nucleotide exchange factor domain-containing protein [Chlamydoabsidia padenii]